MVNCRSKDSRGNNSRRHSKQSLTALDENCITTTKKNIHVVVDAVDWCRWSSQIFLIKWTQKTQAGSSYATTYCTCIFIFFAIIDEIIPGDGQYGWVRIQPDLSTQKTLPSYIKDILYRSRLLLPAKACAGAPLEDTNSSVRGFTKELVFVKQAVEAAHACRRRTVEPCSTNPSRRSKLSESSVTPKLRNWIKTKRRTLVMNRNAR